MSETSHLKLNQCLTWTTELPSTISPAKRSGFFIFGRTKCFIELELLWPNRYNLNMRAGNSEALYPPFQYKLYIEHKVGDGKSTEIFQVSRDISPGTYVRLFTVTDDGDLLKAPGFGVNPQLTFKLLVEESGTSALRLPSDIEHKSTQVDLRLIQPSLEDLSLDLNHLFDKAIDPDVRVECNGGIVHAHRAILTARSTVFAPMFMPNAKKSWVVDMSDRDISTVRSFLKFMYSGKLPDVPWETVPSIYALAYEYDVPSLMKVCSDLMVKNVSEDNYISYLTLADDHQDDYFKNPLIDFVTENAELLQKESWLVFSAESKTLALEVYQKYVRKSLAK